jgi:glutamyl-tRNA reductase
LLSTCLRVEIMWEGSPEEGSGLLASIYGDKPMPEGAILRTEHQVFHHLCRVAAGLESPTLGEPEVLSQFRQAIDWFAAAAPEGALLGRVLDVAVGVSRKIRRHLGETRGSSLAAAAAVVANPHRPVSILGAGAMSRATAGHLSEGGVRVYSRRQELVSEAESRPWEALPEAFAGSAVVVSTVPGPTDFGPGDGIESALASRNTPLLLADLGMPPGFDWLQNHPMITFLGIDEIASSVARPAHPELDEMIEAEATAAWARLSAPHVVGQVIAAMVDNADRAVDEEVRRFVGKLLGAEDPEAVLRQLAHTVARRVLHPPISYVGSSPGSGEAAQVLGKAYGIIDE